MPLQETYAAGLAHCAVKHNLVMFKTKIAFESY